MSKFLKQLDKELKEKSKKPDIHIKEAIPIVGSILMLLLVMSSSIILFYSVYMMYALIVSVCCALLLFWIENRYTIGLPLIGLTMVIIVTFTLVLPILAHYILLDKKEVCFDTTLKNKYFNVKMDGGTIHFEQNKSNTNNTLNIDTISGIPRYEYSQLPPIGSKVKICSEISKVGYQYTSIEAY